MLWEREGNVPVERDGDIACVNRSENKTQIRHQCPGEEGPHASFDAEEIFDATTGCDGRDGGDDASDETADEDACDVGGCGYGEAEDAVEEG